jgi:hypothetical protein
MGQASTAEEGGEKRARVELDDPDPPSIDAKPPAGEEDTWECPRCGTRVRAEDAQGHQDFHMASDLQAKEEAAAGPAVEGSRRTPPVAPSRRGGKGKRGGGRQGPSRGAALGKGGRSLRSYFARNGTGAPAPDKSRGHDP